VKFLPGKAEWETGHRHRTIQPERTFAMGGDT